jgi:hypothetical protein
MIAVTRSAPATQLQLKNRGDGSGIIGFGLFDLGTIGFEFIPPGLFLKNAVRQKTYRKRHASQTPA